MSPSVAGSVRGGRGRGESPDRPAGPGHGSVRARSSAACRSSRSLSRSIGRHPFGHRLAEKPKDLVRPPVELLPLSVELLQFAGGQPENGLAGRLRVAGGAT